MQEGARKRRKIRILPNSGATVTLCHAKVAKRLGLKVTQKDSGMYELFDAQGKRMEVMDTCVIYVVLEG